MKVTRPPYTFRFFLAALLLLSLMAGSVSAQNLDLLPYQPKPFGKIPLRLKVLSGSSISFYAKATFHWFTGTSRQMSGDFLVDNSGFLPGHENQLIVLSRSLKTGINARDAMVRKTLNAEQAPHIIFTPKQYELGEHSHSLGEYKVTLKGDLTIANVTREKNIKLFIKNYDNKSLITGNTDIKLSDFGINAPTLLGIMGVKDAITVKWSLEGQLEYIFPTPDTEPATDPLK